MSTSVTALAYAVNLLLLVRHN